MDVKCWRARACVEESFGGENIHDRVQASVIPPAISTPRHVSTAHDIDPPAILTVSSHPTNTSISANSRRLVSNLAPGFAVLRATSKSHSAPPPPPSPTVAATVPMER
jgi:hypothetical protein